MEEIATTSGEVETERKKKTVSMSEPDNLSEISAPPIPPTKFQEFQQKYLKHAPQVGAIGGALFMIIYSGKMKRVTFEKLMDS
jgi:hypothetical protein